MVGLHYDVQPKVTRGNVHVQPVGGKICLQQRMSSLGISVMFALMDAVMKIRVAVDKENEDANKKTVGRQRD